MGRLEDGRVAFVAGTAPGDVVLARVLRARRRWLRAELVRVVEPAASRVEPACADFGRCGGCAWQHIDYVEQVKAKREILRDALMRIGGFASLPEVRMHASPEAYRYRGRARLVASGGALGHRARASHRVVVPASCEVLAPGLEAARRAAASGPALAAAPDAEWELALGDDGATRVLPLPVAGGSLGAGDRLTITSLGHRVGVGPGVFFQANVQLREGLAEEVCRQAATHPGAFVLELFAGAGFFTLPLAERCGRVVAVESNAAAVADLAENLARAGYTHVEPVCDRAEHGLAQLEETPDVVVLDPPRSGLEPQARADLARLAAPRLVYVSCDPGTLARDLAGLRDDYVIDAVSGWDLFPQTPHVEAVVTLRRA